MCPEKIDLWTQQIYLGRFGSISEPHAKITRVNCIESVWKMLSDTIRSDQFYSYGQSVQKCESVQFFEISRYFLIYEYHLWKIILMSIIEIMEKLH